MTGGLAPVAQKEPGEVYQRVLREWPFITVYPFEFTLIQCLARLTRKNEIYYKKYPADVARVRKIVAYLESNNVTTPNGSRLSPAAFQLLGMSFGMHGGIDDVHRE